MLVSVILAIIFIAVFASLFTQGLWNNTITLVNVITSALIATNYFEPVADFLTDQEPSWTYVWDFAAIWLLFGVSMFVLRLGTDFMSRTNVRFIKPMDMAGGYLMAIWTSWIVLCFATMTMHTAPLSRHFLRGGFQRQPDSKMLFGLAPDRVWMAWVHRESKGALSRFRGAAPFDASGDFIVRYSNRRGEFETQEGLLVAGEQKKAPTPKR